MIRLRTKLCPRWRVAFFVRDRETDIRCHRTATLVLTNPDKTGITDLISRLNSVSSNDERAAI